MADAVTTAAAPIEQERWERIEVRGRVLGVSNLGNVRDARGVALTVTTRPDGYRTVGWRRDNQTEQVRVYVHRLVATAFLGPPQPGREARHLRGVENGDGVGNLAWGSSSANKRDTILKGVMVRGESHPRAVFTERTVIALRVLRPFIPARILAEWLDVGEPSVSKVQLGLRWGHVTGSMSTEEALKHIFGGSPRTTLKPS